jgi:phage tail-like protein
MTLPDPSTSTRLDTLIGDLLAVVRRHDPAWTASNESDPGVTLLEIGAWIADWLESTSGIRVSQTVWGAAARSDPYRDFNFRVKWDGVVIVGVTRISALRRSADIVEHREGGAPDVVHRLPGRVVYEPFTLERPLGADTSFEDWADLLREQRTGATWRKDVRIEILNHAGWLFLAYDVYGCWPAAYRILPDLTESLTLVPDGWQRDRSVQPVA